MKRIKKVLSKFFPESLIKENLKLFFYRLTSPKNIEFGIVSSENSSLIYKTEIKKIDLYTTEALYTIVKDFDYYLHFYDIKKGDVIIDAGANVGIISLFFSKKNWFRWENILFRT